MTLKSPLSTSILFLSSQSKRIIFRHEEHGKPRQEPTEDQDGQENMKSKPKLYQWAQASWSKLIIF